MSQEIRKKLNEWGITDIEFISRVEFVLSRFEEKARLFKEGYLQFDDLDDAIYILAMYTKDLPPRKSIRNTLKEIALLVLLQVEAFGMSSISRKRFGWLLNLLSETEYSGGLGLIHKDYNDEQWLELNESCIEDLHEEGHIIVDPGSLALSKKGREYMYNWLLRILSQLYHKDLDMMTDQIDFWIVAVTEHEKEVEQYFVKSKITPLILKLRKGKKNQFKKGQTSLNHFLRSQEQLYQLLLPKVNGLVREYRQTVQPEEYYDTHEPAQERWKGSFARVEENISDIAKFSRNVGEGVTRLAFSREETNAMNCAKEWLLSNFDFRFKSDPFLNYHFYDCREGKKRILVGTHLDTVLDGGRFDGVVGLVSFIEALKIASEEGRDFPLPVDFIIFRAEESTVFKVALLGSKVATGNFSVHDLGNMRFDRDRDIKENLVRYYPEYGNLDPKPTSLLDILSKQSDISVDEIRTGCWFFDYAREDYVAYVEIHIEQARVLERQRKNLGIVTSFRAPVREIVTIQGRWDHSGGTPMGPDYRLDALCAAAECVLANERIGEEESAKGTDVVTTVGVIHLPGMGINKIPGECVFTVDLRSSNLEERKRVYARIHKEFAVICEKRKVDIKFVQTENSEPISLMDDPESLKLQDKLERAIRKLSYSYTKTPSGAGHDAMSVFHSGIPTCMLFIPCKEGISHSPLESAQVDDIIRAAKVLLNFLCDFEIANIYPIYPDEGTAIVNGFDIRKDLKMVKAS